MAPDIGRTDVREYLLGAMDPIDAEALEVRYVADPALADEIRDEEHVLVDDYLADRLTAVDRARFERHYLASPVHRDRVAMARALGERVAAAAPGATAGSAFYGWMAAAAAVVVMSLWLTARPGPPPREAHMPQPPPAAPAPVAAPSPSSSANPNPNPNPNPLPSSPVPVPSMRAAMAIALSSIAVRGSSAPSAHELPAEPVDLLLRLEGAPDPGDRTYVVEVQRVDGSVAWRGTARTASRGSGLLATATIPAGTLTPDDYIVVASAGGAERGRYSLRLRGPRR